MKKKIRVGAVAAAAFFVAASVLSAEAASANTSQTFNFNGSSAASANYDTSANRFQVKDLKADGYGVTVEYSFTGISGVRYVSNSGGSNSTTTSYIAIPKGATQINWRITLKNGATVVARDIVIKKDVA
ncbi:MULTISPECIES: hypothetical protein [unclassified Microbacterium]|uniref:hypothetical protein n=1 Tax=unclassified Microbacterium TaxID=2609290 RepID=UPI00109BFB53|nr:MULTISPECIES: hypothetical protein [unclassified Microbacterium]